MLRRWVSTAPASRRSSCARGGSVRALPHAPGFNPNPVRFYTITLRNFVKVGQSWRRMAKSSCLVLETWCRIVTDSENEIVLCGWPALALH